MASPRRTGRSFPASAISSPLLSRKHKNRKAFIKAFATAIQTRLSVPVPFFLVPSVQNHRQKTRANTRDRSLGRAKGVRIKALLKKKRGECVLSIFPALLEVKTNEGKRNSCMGKIQGI